MIVDAYEAALAAGTHQRDPAQRAALAALADLQRRLLVPQPRSLRATAAAAVEAVMGAVVGAVLRTATRTPPNRGLYLWGGVGRGKTWLMDLFHATLPRTDARRVHFHRFMRGVHRDLKRVGGTRDPLATVAAGIARDTRVLCFDELFVSDIGDAMLLGRLFESLFARGVTLVATSNVPPGGLYRDGLQRAAFLPAITAIEEHCDVVEIGAGVDYRLRALQHAPLYIVPPGPDADRRLAELFERVASGAGAPAALEVEGRVIDALRVADGVAWFRFDALCAGPRGADDYIELARTFHTVLVSGVPRLDATLENEARRFVALIDEFYDRRVKLGLSAAERPASLYAGDALRNEFARTQSRLAEMQSAGYLAEPHRG